MDEPLDPNLEPPLEAEPVKKPPTEAQLAALAAGRERLAEKRAGRVPQSRLSTEAEGELQAMRWVTTHAPADDRTWEQKSAREFKDASPGRFYERKARLEEAARPGEGPPNGGPSQGWDGTGPCPLCKHEPEKRLEDPQTDMILGQIDRLLKRANGEGLT